MIFVSERIINISELEALLSATRLNYEMLLCELQKEAPMTEMNQQLSCAIKNALEKAENFEFCIEKRKCVFKEDSGNPKCTGNLINEDSLA